MKALLVLGVCMCDSIAGNFSPAPSLKNLVQLKESK